MTKSVSTNFGEPLSTESKKLVDEVRLKINQPIHPNVRNNFLSSAFELKCEASNYHFAHFLFFYLSKFYDSSSDWN